MVGDQRPIARDGKRRHNEEQGYVDARPLPDAPRRAAVRCVHDALSFPVRSSDGASKTL